MRIVIWLVVLLNPIAASVLAYSGDITMNTTAKQYGFPAVVFPHWAHRLQFTCQACHPAVFRMKAGSHMILMERMAARGTFCLACHNGEIAWKPVNCGRCHVGRQEAGGSGQLAEGSRTPQSAERKAQSAESRQKQATSSKQQAGGSRTAQGAEHRTQGVKSKEQSVRPAFSPENRNPEEALKDLPRDETGEVDWVAAVRRGFVAPRWSLKPKPAERIKELPDLLMTRTQGLPPVVFSHSSHALWLGCDNCHPDPFVAKKAANVVSMADIYAGRFCGKCHGRVAFSIQHCDRCHQP